MGILLAAHRLRHAGVRIPAARLLTDPPAAAEHCGLPPNLVVQRGLHALEGVEVLDLDLGAEPRLARRPQADVRIAAHVAQLEVALAHVRVDEKLTQGLQEGERLGGRGELGLGDQFHQRHAAAVEVNAAEIRVVDALGHVLLEMDARDADPPRPPALGHVEMAAEADREGVLGDLVVLGDVGIEVALAVELADAGDLAVEQHAGHGAQAHGLAVEGRQRAGIAEADRADLRVGLGAGLRGAAAEHLRARLELDMDLESDGDLVVHGRSSARRPAVSQAAAMRNTRPSANAGPSTWSPTGRPAAVAPAGTETAQTPARLAGTV